MSEEDVENLIHNQEDSSGNINYEQFVKMVLANWDIWSQILEQKF